MGKEYQKNASKESEASDEIYFQETYQTRAYLSNGGYLVISQDSFEHGQAVSVYLSPDQIEAIGRYAESMRDEHWSIWNRYKDSQSFDDDCAEEE